MKAQLYISEASPYSMKAYAFCAYAGLEFEPVLETAWNRFAVIRRLTGKTMVPTLRMGDFAISDSTRILKHVAERTGVAAVPDDDAPLAWLIEDFADEWVLQWMLKARWGHDENIAHLARVVGAEMFPRGLRRVGGRLAMDTVRSQILAARRLEPSAAHDASYVRTMALLEELFAEGDYVFGGTPYAPDFALYGMLLQLFNDPSGRRLPTEFPHLAAFVTRVGAWIGGNCVASGTRRDVSQLAPLVGEILGTYWRLLLANRTAQGSVAAFDALDGLRGVYQPARWYTKCLEQFLENTAAQAPRPLSSDPGIAEALAHAVRAAVDDR